MRDRIIKIFSVSVLFVLGLFVSNAQNVAVNMYASILDSIQKNDIYHIADSLEGEKYRYYVPDSVLADTLYMNLYLADLDHYIDSLSRVMIEDRSHRREASDLLRYVNRYDVMRNAVHPLPAHIIPKDSMIENISKMSPLFMPLVFNARKRVFHMSWQEKQKENIPEAWKNVTRKKDQEANLYVARLARQILLDMEVQHLDLVKYREKDLPDPERLEVKLNFDRPIRWTPPERHRPAIMEAQSVPVKYTHWIIKGRFSNQLTQTYVSPNWSSGGNSNMSTLHSFYWTAKYDDKKNVQFDNMIDIRIGLNTTESDSLRKFNISNDQFQLSSKLGIKAVKNWYYSVSTEFVTQLLNNYKANTYTLKSSFLSPAKLFVSLGMDYKIKDIITKGSSLSVLVTPFTYKLNYLRDNEKLNPSSYGIDEGKHFGSEFGFKVTTTFDFKISDDISWNSYIYYYSDFSYIDSEWRNTINFTVNQYLSTQLFIHLKMDDRIRKEENTSLIQLKEYLSFGFVYYW